MISPTVPDHNFGWSKRILLAGTAGILFLTLYPFRFVYHPLFAEVQSPVFLNGSLKRVGVLDFVLNVLLFVPFGFGLAEKVEETGASRRTAFAWAFLAGALFSYVIEFLQAFIPLRDSGWEDVFTNSAGSVVGFFLFATIGRWLLPRLSQCEAYLRRWFSSSRLAWIGVSYFLVWLAVSIPLQRETNLRSWDSAALLVIGNEPSGQLPWNGEVLCLQLWDKALPESGASAITREHDTRTALSQSAASYRLLGAPPFADEGHLLPPLSLFPRETKVAAPAPFEFSGTTWLWSAGPLTALINRIKQSGQFSLRILCKPRETNGARGRIVTIAGASSVADVTVQQTNSDLILWFRSAFTPRSQLAWRVSDVFQENMLRDILLAYDGLYFSLYVDGRRAPLTYQVGPGTGLAHLIRRVKTNELAGYRYIYYVMFFVPIGWLFGIATVTPPWRSVLGVPLSALLFIALAITPETLLALVSGRSFSLMNLALSLGSAAVGALWINADRPPDRTIGANE